jgi:phosphoketolase
MGFPTPKQERQMTRLAERMRRLMLEWDAGITELIANDRNGVPVVAVFAVRGDPQTAELIAAVKALEAKWERERQAATSSAIPCDPSRN